MNKEDFQSKYPSYGHKFYEAFRQLIHQLQQQQQQQQQHSPPIIEGPNATDLLGLQSMFGFPCEIRLWSILEFVRSFFFKHDLPCL